MTTAEPGKRTYLLEMKDGTRKKITVPDTWKVTFGPVHPGSERNTGHQGIALRFWAGSTKTGQQMAVFTEVASFRTLNDMQILEEVVERKRETFVRQGDESGEQVVAEAAVRTWADPDAPKQSKSAFEPAGKGLPQLLVVQR